MKRTFSTLLLFSLLHAAFAGVRSKIIIIPAAKNFITITDTVPYVIDEDEMNDYNDSLISFPAYDLYCGWDTVNTHFARFNIETLRDSVREIALTNPSSCGYVHPFTGNVTSGFGPRKRRFHYGTDIDLETGDAVGTAFDGKVRIAKKSKSYGNVVVIRHSNGLETYYAHLSKINVETGQEVYAGQVIGLGGNTGHSHGSHLHFEIRYLGQPINPTDIISFTDHKLICDTLCLSKKTFDYVSEAKRAAYKTYASSKRTKTSYNNTKNAKVYVVKKGDTLYAIARRYGTTPKALSQKNGLRMTSTLRLGQKVKL